MRVMCRCVLPPVLPKARINNGYLPLSISSIFFGRGALTEPGTTLVGHLLSLSPTPSTRVTGTSAYLAWVLKSKLRPSCLHCEHSVYLPPNYKSL